MRRIISLLSLLLFLSLCCHAQLDLISTHRDWVKQRYADLSAFTEEQLLTEALDLVDNYLQEPEGLGLLRALSGKIPELEGYASFVERQVTDTLFRNTLGAVDAIARYAEEKYPTSLLAARARTDYLTGAGNLQNLDAEWETQIKKWEKISRSNTDPELKAQIIIMKIMDYCQREVRRGYDEPNEYPRIFEFEKEALEIYPPDSSDRSFTRAMLYYWLGELKTFIVEDLVGEMLQSGMDYNRDTDFVLTGGGGRFLNNSMWYFRKALEITEELFNPGHPKVRSIAQAALNLESNTHYLSPSLFDRLKTAYDYVRFYYPSDSQELASSRILWVLTCMIGGRPTSDDLFLRRSADVLEASLGKTNPIYHQHLFQLALCRMFADPEDDTWILRMKDAMMVSGLDEDSDEVNFQLAQVYRYLYSLDPALSQEKMEEIHKKYKKQHSGSPFSLRIGHTLASYYFYYVYNFELGQEVINDVIRDYTDLVGKEIFNDFNFWNYSLISAENSGSNFDKDFLENYFRKQLTWTDASKISGRDILRYHLKYRLASYLGNTKKQFGTAAETYAECLPLIPENNPDARLSCLNGAVFFSFLDGKPAEYYETWLQEAEKICKETPHSQLHINDIRDHANNLFNEGDSQRALEWLLEAERLFIDQNGEGAYSPDYIMLRRDLANTYQSLGNLVEARRIFAEDTDLLSDSYGVVSDPTLIDSLWLEYYVLKGDNSEDWVTLLSKLQRISELSNQLYVSSGNDLRIRDTYILRFTSEVIHLISLNINPMEIGSFQEPYRSYVQGMMGNLKEYSEVLERWLKEIRISNPDYIEDADYRQSVVALSTYYKNVENDLPKVIKWVKELLGDSITESNATNYSDYISLLYMTGRKDEADRIADRLEEAMKGFKPDFTSIKDFMEDYRVGTYITAGEPERALPYARENYLRHKGELDGNFRLMTKREQENYMNRHGDPSNLLVGLLQYLPDQISGECYDAVIYRTGMQLRSHRATMDAIERSDDPTLRSMLDSIESMRVAINHDMHWTPDMSQEENTARTQRLASLMHKSNRMEQRLLDAVRNYADMEIKDVTWQQIRDRLKDNEAAIEFVFSNTDVLALILRSDMERPQVISLCESADLIGKLIGDGAHNSSSRAKNLYSAGDPELYAMLWQPLEGTVDGCDTIYYSPQGILGTLAFNAFALPDGGHLFDRYNLVQLTTTGQLVFDRVESTPESIAMMGDILYYEGQQPLTPDSPGVRDIDDDFDFGDSYSDERGVLRAHFRHLPFTALEIKDIAGEFAAHRVDTVRRYAATESELRRMASSTPDVIHLATHGYYISPDSDISRYPFLRNKGSGTMQRSGIALAGAENTWRGIGDTADDNDGILTASEVASLDLRGTGLVALSACETALGDFSFEGIFGLQRGFKQAGVQSLLVSLWSVNDHSTALFMQEFYRSLRSGCSRYDSWRRAVDRVRSEYPDPYYWAPFILLD